MGSLHEYFINHCIWNYFSTFQIICSIYFMVVFLRDPGEKLFNIHCKTFFLILNKPPEGTGLGLRPRHLHTTINLPLDFLNTCISNLFVPYLLWLFFKGPGEKLFIKHYYQSFIKHYYQSFWYNPHIYSRQIFFTLLIYYIDIQKSVIRLFCNSFVTFHYVSIHTTLSFFITTTPTLPHHTFFLLSFFAIIRLIILHVWHNYFFKRIFILLYDLPINIYKTPI
jgi:hypothetical protein